LIGVRLFEDLCSDGPVFRYGAPWFLYRGQNATGTLVREVDQSGDFSPHESHEAQSLGFSPRRCGDLEEQRSFFLLFCFFVAPLLVFLRHLNLQRGNPAHDGVFFASPSFFSFSRPKPFLLADPSFF